MKKVLMPLMAMLICIAAVCPASAAAETLSVAALNASYAGGQVSYGGTVASGVKAAAVLLFDSEGTLVMMDTCEVSMNGTFSGTMEANLISGGIYIIKASDYEGGTFTEVTLAVDEPASTEKTKDSVPKTGDNSNTALVFVLMILSGAGIFGTALYGKGYNRRR